MIRHARAHAQSGNARTPHHPAPLHHSAVEALADRLQRLAPSHRDPEAFHVEKSSLVAELRELAGAMRRGGRA
jgi:hypothetical protein